MPSYIVLNGHDVMGFIYGSMGADYVVKEYDKIIKQEPICSLDDYSFQVIDIETQQSTLLTDILPASGYAVLEVHMITCPDCKMVDGIPGTYKIYTSVDENGKPDINTAQEIAVKKNDICEIDIVHSQINATFIRYYLKSNIEAIKERYGQD